MAMIVIAMRSSTTARVSRNERSADGSDEPITASTARAKAMSVAVGIAHPRRASPSAPTISDGGDEDQRGHDDAADGRHHRHHRLGRRAQVADEELALELEPRDEEEDGEQAVAGPVPDGEVEVRPTRCRRTVSRSVK